MGTLKGDFHPPDGGDRIERRYLTVNGWFIPFYSAAEFILWDEIHPSKTSKKS